MHILHYLSQGIPESSNDVRAPSICIAESVCLNSVYNGLTSVRAPFAFLKEIFDIDSRA